MNDLVEHIAALNDHAREHKESLTLYPTALDHLIEKACAADRLAADLTREREERDGFEALAECWQSLEQIAAGQRDAERERAEQAERLCELVLDRFDLCLNDWISCGVLTFGAGQEWRELNDRDRAALASVRPGREQENVAHRPVTDEETDAVIKRAVERESEFYRPVREGDDT